MTVAPDVVALTRRAEQLLQAGQVLPAIEAYRALLDVTPDQADAWYNLGYLYRTARMFDGALTAYAQALAHSINQSEAVHVNRAAILSEHLLRFADAEQELRAALAVAPQFLPAWHNLGQLYEDLNDRAQARETYCKILAFAPQDGRAHARLTALDVFDGRARAAIARLRVPIASATDPVDRAELEFAIANAYDAVGDYQNAFDMARRANARAAAMLPRPYDRLAQDRLIDALIAAFPAPIPSATSSLTRPEPIFICGMFRSGSTLCEQVVARHSRVTAGGELEALGAMTALIGSYPQAIGALSSIYMDGLRAGYLHEAQRLFPNADLLTDKRPENFLHIGLIKALFPSARIVHTVRDPRDTMLSAFFLYFGESVSYANALEDFAHYYGGYRRLMAHWEQLYPDIIRFDYDAFVADSQNESRLLLEKLKLDWEFGCDPSRPVDANVRTASAWQVRQPVHGRSAGRWRNYARQIAPILPSLGITD